MLHAIRPYRLLKQRRLAFQNQIMKTQTDEEFCLAANKMPLMPLERQLMCLVRNIVAENCNQPQNYLVYEITGVQVEQLMGNENFWSMWFGGPYEFDPDDFLLTLTAAIRQNICPQFVPPSKLVHVIRKTYPRQFDKFGDWVMTIVEKLYETIDGTVDNVRKRGRSLFLTSCVPVLSFCSNLQPS